MLLSLVWGCSESTPAKECVVARFDGGTLTSADAEKLAAVASPGPPARTRREWALDVTLAALDSGVAAHASPAAQLDAYGKVMAEARGKPAETLERYGQDLRRKYDVRIAEKGRCL